MSLSKRAAIAALASFVAVAVAACTVGVQERKGEAPAPGVEAAASPESGESNFDDLRELSSRAEVLLRADRPEAQLETFQDFEPRRFREPDAAAALAKGERAVPEAIADDSADPAGLRALLASADELWILERPRIWRDRPAGAGDESPGSGALVARLDGEREVPVPLERTVVAAEVSGAIATVEVRQSFVNPFDTKIEASYVFPLPHDAAVSDFVMTIGDRTIRGIIRERGEAERIYRVARRAGHRAALLTEERPNIFTQRVANIEPGKGIDIAITYFSTLVYSGGAYEFVFPMVVGPRYNPPGHHDPVAALPRDERVPEQGSAVTYLRPDERSGHDIELAISIDAGVPIDAIESVNHLVRTERLSPARARITLSPNDRVPNKDFVLRYRVAGERLQGGLVTHEDERGGFFSLMLFPPDDLEKLERQPVELVFVLDCSGSMRGLPLDKAKRAATRALRRLEPDDTFQIIRFSSSSSQLGPAPIAASAANIRRGIDYLESLDSEVGTRMIEGIEAALEFPQDPARLRLVSFMTDGFIGNEDEIFQAIYERVGRARIFSFGVGTSVNRHLLEGMARIGRGAVAYVSLDEGVEEIVDSFYERIRHPAMSDLEIDWGGLEVSEVFPKSAPDLFAGRPLLITGRYRAGSAPSGMIRIDGRAGPLDQSISIAYDLSHAEKHPGVASVWARKQIEVLGDHAARAGGSSELAGEIERVALEYNLVSRFTAFVAVDSSSVTAGDSGVEVRVPVPVPDGVRYSTTVGK